jgi:hypothetical protein
MSLCRRYGRESLKRMILSSNDGSAHAERIGKRQDWAFHKIQALGQFQKGLKVIQHQNSFDIGL